MGPRCVAMAASNSSAAGIDAFFGAAAQFAANSSTGDGYTEQRANQLAKNATRALIVARAAPGESFRASRPTQQATKPPDNHDGVDFDSVWVDISTNGGFADHLEVMIYSEAQPLPVARVDYRHATSCNCALSLSLSLSRKRPGMF
ncbi:unnamed protein product [Prorocentrum cordatum]|uniref:Uncharacterized protein n=1 Tax=Prorocentrum cordatum TaxID=2364126 RepID=A0ABN9VGU9_9DINO|nr:unnamed protein product [Polarella glacialis]